jgi:membrane-anchored protein YejM (alkaline phosphatase superfamily)
MDNIQRKCIDFFQNDDMKKYIKEILKPVAQIVYDEIYIYIWIICIYNVFLFFFILAILFLLIFVIKNKNVVV